jgi:hypothetical protein
MLISDAFDRSSIRSDDGHLESQISTPNNNDVLSTESTNSAKTAPILNDSLTYVDRVKAEFLDRPEIYSQFLDVMRAFKAEELDTLEVIEHIQYLFAGNDRLTLAFEAFLPPNYNITPCLSRDPKFVWKARIIEKANGQKVTFSTANNFAVKVKVSCQNRRRNVITDGVKETVSSRVKYLP